MAFKERKLVGALEKQGLRRVLQSDWQIGGTNFLPHQNQSSRAHQMRMERRARSVATSDVQRGLSVGIARKMSRAHAADQHQ